jgi:nitrogen fixation/metabolism regulation signal transduction histidine kinase
MISKRATGMFRAGHETRLALTAILAGLPAVAAAIFFLWTGDHSPDTRWTLTFFILFSWIGFSVSIRGRAARPLQAIANVLSSLREGDYSLRARPTRRDDALGEVISEINTFGVTLREQRLGAVEASTLLETVIEEIDVAVFAFSGSDVLMLANRAGERLFDAPKKHLIGRSAEDLRLAACLTGESVQLINTSFPGGTGRWESRRSVFRRSGLPHRLLVLADLSRTLRDEERQAWQRLIRVLGHELNNSLAPIKSIAGSLLTLLERDPRPSDWEDDARRGLGVIQKRSDSLNRFMAGYTRLAQLPPPMPRRIHVAGWIHRAVSLEPRINADIIPGPDLEIWADEDQLDQLLINLLRNAADAVLDSGGTVRVSWTIFASSLHLWIEDDGPGISNSANLFVPFFTTKPNGSGIGLALCRQIAEAHSGSLSLENRKNARGCRALLRLPIRERTDGRQDREPVVESRGD